MEEIYVDEIYKTTVPYLNTARVEELGLWGVPLEITKVSTADLKGVRKVVLTLRDKDGIEYGLPLNRTNAMILQEAWGRRANDWVGKKITLRKTKRSFARTLVDAIEVIPIEEAREARKK